MGMRQLTNQSLLKRYEYLWVFLVSTHLIYSQAFQLCSTGQKDFNLSYESLTSVRIRSHGSNTTWNSSEFPRYVYLLVIQFLETPDFLMFSISGNSGFSDVFHFWKLQIFRCFPFPENSGTPTFLISGNSRLRCFPIFLYYVITLISCLHLSLVTPSAVVSTSLSLDLQFPFALLYCFRLCNSDPLLCTRYIFIPLLSL